MVKKQNFVWIADVTRRGAITCIRTIFTFIWQIKDLWIIYIWITRHPRKSPKFLEENEEMSNQPTDALCYLSILVCVATSLHLSFDEFQRAICLNLNPMFYAINLHLRHTWSSLLASQSSMSFQKRVWFPDFLLLHLDDPCTLFSKGWIVANFDFSSKYANH